MRNGFTITIISWLFHKPKSAVPRYHMDKSAIIFSWEYCYMAKQKSSIRTISETFKTTYPSIRCIKDCTKDASKPSLLSSQSSLY